MEPKKIGWAALFIMVSFIVAAFTSQALPIAEQDRQPYEQCIADIQKDAVRALDDATAWVKRESSIAAYHCKAMAEFQLQRYGSAANTLQQLDALLPATDVRMKRSIAVQTVRSWRMAGEYDKALQIAHNEIKGLQQPEDRRDLAAMLLERSRAYLARHQRLQALQDLDHILTLEPEHLEASLQRARLYLLLHDEALAIDEAQRILRIHPNNPQAMQLLKYIAAATKD